MKALPLLVSFLSFLSCQALANDDATPFTYYTFNNSLLNLTRQQSVVVYVLTNKSAGQILIDKANHNGSAQAGYSSTINAGNSSALVLGGSQTLNLSCAHWTAPNSPRRANCKNVLDVDVYAQATFSQPTTGNYWLVEDMPMNKLQSQIPLQYHVQLNVKEKKPQDDTQ